MTGRCKPRCLANCRHPFYAIGANESRPLLTAWHSAYCETCRFAVRDGAFRPLKQAMLESTACCLAALQVMCRNKEHGFRLISLSLARGFTRGKWCCQPAFSLRCQLCFRHGGKPAGCRRRGMLPLSVVIGMVCKKNVHPIHIERTPQLYMNRISYSLFFPSSLSLGHGGVGVAQLLAHGEVGHGGCDED